MEPRGGGFVRALAVICAILLVVVLPLALLAFDIGRVAFNPPLLKCVLTDEVVNSDLIPVALEWFSDRRAQQRVESGEALTGVTEPDIVLLMSYLNRDDWRRIKAEVLTDEMLAAWVSVMVDGAYAWIGSDDLVPQVTFDLQPLKARVDSEHGVNGILIAYGKLPPCTDDQIVDFQVRLDAAPAGTEVLYNLCQFPDPWHEDQFSDYVDALSDVVAAVPDSFALTSELTAASASPVNLQVLVLKQQLRLLRTVMSITWAFPLALLLLILLLKVRTLDALARWWGVPLLIGGALTLVVALVLRGTIGGLLAGRLLWMAPEIIVQEAIRSVNRLLAEVFRPMLLQAGVVTAIGLVLTVFVFVRRQREG
ncbi:MAG: hypothetical protein GX620_11480 [Chloroflexi bacterium]|nr:hypothetical protein [Chloroflexota bacterium]